MRCPACNHEVAQATKCPACERVIPRTHQSRNGSTHARGEFRGRMDASGHGRKGRGWSSIVQAMRMLLRDPQAPFFSKVVLVVALVYIIVPLDFLPGGLIPVIGWLDDIIIGLLAWSYLKPDLNRYRE